MSGEAPTGVTGDVATRATTASDFVPHIGGQPDTGRPGGGVMGTTVPFDIGRPADATTPTDIPNSAEADTGRSLARTIIDSSIREVNKKLANGTSLTTTDREIISIDILQREDFTPQDYTEGIPMPENLQVLNNDGELITVFEIRGTKTEGGRTYYVCATDPSDQSKTTDVLTDRLAAGYAGKTTLVDRLDDSQSAIFMWYAGGEQGSVPTEAIKQERSPMTQANRMIAKRIQELAADIDQVDKATRESRNLLIAQLEFALKADGDKLGALAKMEALRKLDVITPSARKMEALRKLDVITPSARKAEKQRLTDAIDALQPKAAEAKTNLEQILAEAGKKAGLSKGDIEKIKAGGLEALLGNGKLMEKFMAIPDIQPKLFGKNAPTDSDIDAMAGEHLTPEQKAATEAKHGKKGLILAILLALLAVPIVIPGAAVAASTRIVGGLTTEPR